MFKTKNLSPQYLSFIAAIFISLVVGFIFAIVTNDFLLSAAIFIGLVISIFLFLRYILNWFIYRKIKLIYKLIYTTKANKKIESYYKYILPKKSIDEVSDEVEKWAVQHATEIEIANRNEVFRKEFLQNLSHELKTPIFAIQGYLEAVLPEFETESISKRFLNNAFKNVERMVHLVDNLDEISRLETGEQPLQKTKFVIQDLCNEVFEDLSIKLQERNIKASIKQGCETPINVLADKEKIRQVLTNLVVNACKYGKQDGTIYAGVYRTDDTNVLVEISDNGIGIAEEHLSRIFERFYRTDAGRSRNTGGSGLGLAICKHIIEAHGKTILVRSTPNVGTTIAFTLDAK
ncbi:MAG: sensor histidine kinase [Chitinophagaceae bacterium]|nr:sensor histidine kinase [Chitinophagaceae bacterium]